MGLFTGLSANATLADVINKMNEWASILNGDLDDTNLDSSYAIDVSRVNNAAATTGFHLTGNISCDDGVTIDGQDVSELGNQIQVIQNNIDQDVVSKSNMVVTYGTLSPGDTILSKLQAVDSSINETDYYIYYQVGLVEFDASQTGNNGTGMRKITCNYDTVLNTGFTYTIWDEDASDTSDPNAGVTNSGATFSYFAIAIKK